MRIGGRALLAGGLAVLGALAAASAPRLALQRVDVSRLPDIHVYFTVTGDRGESLIGLTGREITVFCDGLEQPVTALRLAVEGGEAMAVVLLFDRSGSTRSAIGQARDAAAGFIGRLAENDQVAVVSFDEAVSVDLALTADKTAGEAAVRALRPGSDTALFDAVQAGLAEARKAAARRLALVILSDGRDNRSRATPAEAAGQARQEGVAVFTVGLGKAVDAAVLRELAESTGGRSFAAPDPAALLALYQLIGDHMKNQYHLTVRPSFGRDEAWHKLEIRVGPPGEPAEAAAARDFIASTGPGVSRSVLGGFERRGAERRALALILPAAALGALFGLLLAALLKLLRRDLRLSPAAVAGLIGLGALLGGLIGGILAAVS